ncbi:ribonuclease H-like [Bombina bombina]|uniref:ribonuclease H-like n=1 Tax=Bombina bombina TaxID=8345 RepID=UPI00235AD881|nr:ribonuclease H-like [Bombina bombina]
MVQLPNPVITAGSLPFVSAQASELEALAQAFRGFAMKDVTIYTDSRYAFGVVHDFGVIWQNRGFVAADGKSISHSTLVQELLDAIKLPHKLAIVKCKGHSTDSTDIRFCNDFADTIAKEAALQGSPHPDYLNTNTQ